MTKGELIELMKDMPDYAHIALHSHDPIPRHAKYFEIINGRPDCLTATTNPRSIIILDIEYIT